jgi:hypothetical protein
MIKVFSCIFGTLSPFLGMDRGEAKWKLWDLRMGNEGKSVCELKKSSLLDF